MKFAPKSEKHLKLKLKDFCTSCLGVHALAIFQDKPKNWLELAPLKTFWRR